MPTFRLHLTIRRDLDEYNNELSPRSIQLQGHAAPAAAVEHVAYATTSVSFNHAYLKLSDLNRKEVVCGYVEGASTVFNGSKEKRTRKKRKRRRWWQPYLIAAA